MMCELTRQALADDEAIIERFGRQSFSPAVLQPDAKDGVATVKKPRSEAEMRRLYRKAIENPRPPRKRKPIPLPVKEIPDG